MIDQSTVFRCGHIFNKLAPSLVHSPKKIYSEVEISYPTRMEAMALDPSKVAVREDMTYSAGQIDITVDLLRKVRIRVIDGTKDVVHSDRNRIALINHSLGLMRSALAVKDCYEVFFDDTANFRHSGFGSSSGTIAAVAHALNEVYGKPIQARPLVQYLARNHGEDIDGQENMLRSVQCLGGSAACGAYEGSLFVVAGDNLVLSTMVVPDDYSVIIGVPKDYAQPDANFLMVDEEKNMQGFIESGRQYAKEIGYRMLHEVLPAMLEADLWTIGSLIEDYRWGMGSIKNCSFAYPGLIELSKEVIKIRDKGKTPIVSLSSVGPGFFALTKDAEFVKKYFLDLGMNVVESKPFNGTYKVNKLIRVSQ